MIARLKTISCNPSSSSSVPDSRQTPSSLPSSCLPSELILHILTFLCDATDVPTIERGLINRAYLRMARVCRAWYSPVMSTLYDAVAPADLRSARLLLRTLHSRSDLAKRVKSLTIPKDDRLFLSNVITSRLTAWRAKVVRRLVSACPNVVDVRIPIEAALWWKEEVIKGTLPVFEDVERLTSLEVSGSRGTWICPDSRHVVGVAHISPWLCQNQVQERGDNQVVEHGLPNLERLTLSDIALYSDKVHLDHWPYMPNLRYLRLNRPLWPSLGTPNLFARVQPSLRTLHISGIFEALDDHDAFYAFLQYSFTATNALSESLEELILICPGTELPHFPRQFASWYMNDLSTLKKLRYLHLSSCLFHRRLLLRAPPRLGTFVLDIHPSASGGMQHKFDLEEMLSLLGGDKSSLREVVLQVEGETMEEGWVYLSDMTKTFWFSDVGIRDLTYVDLLQREVRKKIDEVGVEIRVELKRGGCEAKCQCRDGHVRDTQWSFRP